MLKQTLRGSAVALMALAGVALAGGVAGAADMKPVKGGTLTIGVETDLQGLDALKAHVLGISANMVATTLMERLMEPDDEGNMRPVLATDVQASDDGLSWVYTLREGVKFHDGSEFTAEDAAFYFNRLLEPKNRYFGRLFVAPMKNVTVEGPHKIAFHLNHPWVAMQTFGDSYSFTTFIGQTSSIKAGTQNRSPGGTGPFVFKEWRPGDRIVVERNPNYWAPEKIHLDEIVFRIMPDQQTRMASLQSGEVDIIWTDRGASVLEAEKDPNLTVHTRQGTGAGIIFLNTAKPPLDNVEARRALSHAWNQDAYVKFSLRGIAPVVDHPLGPDSKCVIDNYRKSSTKLAKEHVEKAGGPFSVDMIHTATQRGREFGEIYQQLAKKAGITMNLKPVDQVQLRQLVFTNNYNISGWRIADTAVQSQLFALLYSKSFYNLTKYKSEEMDKLVGAMLHAPTLEDYDLRACEVVKKMHDDAMILLSAGRQHHAISRPNVHNVPPLWQGTIDPRYVWVSK